MLRRLVPLCLVGVLATACGDDTDRSADDALPASATTAPGSDATPGTDASGSAPADVTTDAPVDESSDAGGDAAGVTTVPAALQFRAPLVGGGEIELGEYAGRPVLLWFWAPW